MDIQTATTVITAATAVLVGIITCRQWLTDRARLKHELFDRRYAIYEKISAFPADIMATGDVQPGADIQFLRDTRLAHFAFGCDDAIKAVVDKLYKLAVELHQRQAELPGLTDTTRTTNINLQTQIKEDIARIGKSLTGIFTKYLKLGH